MKREDHAKFWGFINNFYFRGQIWHFDLGYLIGHFDWGDVIRRNLSFWYGGPNWSLWLGGSNWSFWFGESNWSCSSTALSFISNASTALPEQQTPKYCFFQKWGVFWIISAQTLLQIMTITCCYCNNYDRSICLIFEIMTLTLFDCNNYDRSICLVLKIMKLSFVDCNN